jgi:pycsar effector protein
MLLHGHATHAPSPRVLLVRSARCPGLREIAHADFSGAWLGPQSVATCVLKPGWDMLEAPRLPHHATFVSFEHEYLLAYMQLADAKAAVFMAITSGAIAYIVGHYGLSWVNLEHIRLHLILLPVSTSLLTFAAGSAFSVIVPRIGDAGGIIHFRAVAKRTSAKQFANDVLETSESEMFEAQIAYCYQLAQTCERKYRWLDRSLFTGVLGYAAFLVTLVFL